MGITQYTVEAKTPFSESLIWQLNRDYYNSKGIDAWRTGEVPHNLTSSSMLGKTYAELILAFLKDIANKGQLKDIVYILEVGAGHGRLAFHILKHLAQLEAQEAMELPPYCYVLSDIVEEDLLFFQQHPQFKTYFEKGLLDVAYFDAIGGKELQLRFANTTIRSNDLNQPILVLANYFFDTIPKDLFYIKDEIISSCSLTLNSSIDPKGAEAVDLLSTLTLTYSKLLMDVLYYKDPILNEMLEEYRMALTDTYLFFPQKGLQCLQNLQALSKEGMMIISMDKGTHEIHNLDNKKQPEFVTHGSFSFVVNFHALGAFCTKQGGLAHFPVSSSNAIELACLLFLPEAESYTETAIAYQKNVSDYGPNDFNTLKIFSYKNVASISLDEILGLLRLGAYDSTLFSNFLPRIKQLSQHINFNQRTNLVATMHATWDMYFTLNEAKDLAFEIGGLLYQLGHFAPALEYFQYSIDAYGHTADGYYNRALCYYQLREDKRFKEIVKEANTLFPNYKALAHLDKLDLRA